MDPHISIFVILLTQAFINIGYLIRLESRVTRIETDLKHIMKAKGLDSE